MKPISPLGSTQHNPAGQTGSLIDQQAAASRSQGRQSTVDAQAVTRSAQANDVRDRKEKSEQVRMRFRDKTRLVTEVLDAGTGKVIYEIPPGLRPMEPASDLLGDLLEGEPVLKKVTKP
ncbi:hypothetical protein GCM10007972_23900 [Iodidimonas muriae]|uniref:Flagellar protein FlaG n=1 Tax=Iodidimonas muriae TaxID=261467 RepID=A0ABQ2LFE5_9PROT|nr:flagellar protein FlaG [Iodidimonas muriae]GER08568.1 hypothetical protein JCM17843_28780 [Kordiimonadales bacterium JCM 17843]GGO15607.1 hypothetical protein GCM10007972_23900 [Iodidimonas muriae]